VRQEQTTGARDRPERRGRRPWLLRLGLVVAVLGTMLLPSASPATVAEQRARLPPAATCVDPVEGIWRCHFNDPRRFAWREFTLEIHRAKGSADALTGSITNHGWSGGAEQAEPPICTAGVYRWQIKMDAAGSFRDGKVRFGGTRWWLDKQLCGEGSWGPGSYNLDNFDGTVDPELQEFQSISNDGGALVNVPMVFRRIRCFDEGGDAAPLPEGPVSAPAFAPPVRAASCCGSTER
jgi:hypothetical protein